MLGLPDLTKLPDDVAPIVSDLFTRLNALEGKASTDAAALVHGSLTEALTDAQVLTNPILTRIDTLGVQITRLADLAAPFASFAGGFSVVPLAPTAATSATGGIVTAP